MSFKTHIRIFMSGMLLLTPIVATVAILIWVGSMIGSAGETLLTKIGLGEGIHPAVASLIGVGIMLCVIYLVGLSARLWIFAKGYDLMDRLLSHVPGIKTIYESIRDLLKLFGGDTNKMGRVVIYTQPETHTKQLGILTNDHPIPTLDGEELLAVYLPMGYMIGGPIVLARPEDVEPVDMSVETALKLAATAFVAGPQKKDAAKSENPSNK